MTAAVFDLAINRAAQVVERLGKQHLPIWHRKTRFAVRVPLEKIAEVLETRPEGNSFWIGGESGHWVSKKSQTKSAK